MLVSGDVVGPYEIRGFLGQGGMGQVYRAFDPRLERTVALKVIAVPPADSADSTRLLGEFSARLLREARAVASLSHPNIIAIFDVGESAGLLYFAMEYVVGATLRTLASEPDIPVGRKLRWLCDVARALEVAHRAGLVHRDVKPENVMIRDDGLVKVLDFGIARRTLAQATANEQALDTVTGSGAIVGTPVYMAPEQIKGHVVDPRTDQFAWGVTAYELLAGERPWSDAGDVLALVARVLTDPPPPLRDRVADLPVSVEQTILRTLSKDPEQRFFSMADIADAIEPYATQATARDRVQITPEHEAGHVAYAATTRVPTSVSLAPAAAASLAPPPAKSETKRPRAAKKSARTRARWRRAAVPLGLLVALALAVVIVRRRTATPPQGAPRPLSSVPEAEASFNEALSLTRDGATSRARGALSRAIELDPTFARAYLELALEYAQEDPARAQAAFQRAFEHRHMLDARGATLLEASEPYIRPRPDLEEWETRLTAAVFHHPRDPELQLHLARARERQGDDEGAKRSYEDALRIDPRYVPAFAGLASVERNLDHVDLALAATERCLKQSPIATSCMEVRYRLFSEIGECHKAREEASQWRTVDPQSAAAHVALARSLHAAGAPRASVDEALARSWALVPAPRRTAMERWDGTLLAIVDGDLARADQLAAEYEATLTEEADQQDHAQPARVRVNVLYESGRLDAAANVARTFLDKRDAWTAYPFAPDPSITFYEPLYRHGDIPKERLDEERARWIDREKQRIAGSDHGARAAWTRWQVFGGFAETKAEALEALDHLPTSVELPVGSRRSLHLDFDLGKVYALAGRDGDAIPHLRRVTGTCTSFQDTILVVRARYYLGVAYEAKGEPRLAREAYEQVLRIWPKSTSSRTARWAEQRLAALPK